MAFYFRLYLACFSRRGVAISARPEQQTELSAKSGVSRAIINGLETGRASVTTTETLLKIARALDVTADELFFDENV